MKTAKTALAPDQPPLPAVLDSAQQQLSRLRGSIDARLVELESALADRSRTASLPSLILELSKLATEEAQATAARACLQVQDDTATAVADAEARFAELLDTERRTAVDLRKANERLEAQVASLDAEKQALARTARDHAQTLAAEREERSRVEAQAAATARDLEEARAARAMLEAQLAAAHDQLRAQEAAAGTLSSEQEQALARVDDLERAHADVRAQLEAERSTTTGLRKAISAAQTTMAEHARALAAARERDAGVESRLAELRAAVAAAEHARDSALLERDGIAAERDRALHDRDQESRALAAALTERDASRQAQAEIDASLDELREARAVTTTELEAARTELDALRAELQRLRTETERAHLESDASRAAVTTASTERDAAVAQRDAAVELCDEAARTLERERDEQLVLRRTIADLEQRQQALAAELAAERASLAELHGAARGSSEERDALLREIERLTVAAGTLEQAVADARAGADQANVTIETLRRESDRAARALDAARSDVHSLEQRLAAIESARLAAEERSVDLTERATMVEQERDALSLALDTERMMSADLRSGASASERRIADLTAEIGRLTATVADLQAVAAPSFPDFTVEPGVEEEPAAADARDDEEGWETLRLATRYTFGSDVQVKVNGRAAQLLDLSVAGCGLKATTSLTVGKSVRIHLPGDHPILCVGDVVWIREEAGSPRTWRAGVQFTQVDENAIEAFIIMRAKV